MRTRGIEYNRCEIVVPAPEHDRPKAPAGDASAVRDQLSLLAEKVFSLAMLNFPRFPETDELGMFMDEIIPHFA